MRVLVSLVVLIGLAWSAYWGVGYTAQKRAWDTWFAGRQADGWVAHASERRIVGFPNRFNTTFTDLDLADPSQQWAWHADSFQILALSYSPNHIIVAWPGKQDITTGAAQFSIQSALMRASLVFSADSSLALERLQLEAQDSVVDTETNGATSLGAINAAFFLKPVMADAAPQYDLFAGLENITLAPRRHKTLDPDGLLPDTIDGLSIDATLTFDQLWNRTTVDSEIPALQSVDVKNLKFNWGDLKVRGKGTLLISPQGYPSGAITLDIKNWKVLVNMAAAAGAISTGNASRLKAALVLAARISLDPDNINIPLRFSNRKIYIGPVAIADAPKMRP